MIMYLNILSWVGTSIMAEHYYGKIEYTHPTEMETRCGHSSPKRMKIEIKRKLTKKEAERLTDKDKSYIWDEGETNGQFWTEEALKKVALEMIPSLEHQPDLVLVGDHCIASCQEALYAKNPDLVNWINNIWKKGEDQQLGYRPFTDAKDKEQDRLDKLFNKLIEGCKNEHYM